MIENLGGKCLHVLVLVRRGKNLKYPLGKGIFGQEEEASLKTGFCKGKEYKFFFLEMWRCRHKVKSKIYF